jgi:putative FmdB family regulatory protein
MPTYEYKCQACGHAFERFQPITSDPVKKCPKCGKNKVQRLISTGAGLIFKGSGFYITDYRDKAYTDRAKSESTPAGEAKPAAADAKSAPKSDGKPEAKPAAKAEPKPATESKAPARHAKSKDK